MNEDLLDVIGPATAKDNRFCGTKYVEWEKEVAEPILKSFGYRILQWFNAETDSFGPLMRAVDVERDGTKQTFYYG